MYMKVFPHGQGDGEGPTRYLVRPDYPGRDECPPEVLRGDTELTHALIDSLDTKWKFTAGVLSWHPDDTVTPEQERRVMDDFEQVAFAGLEPDQRNILWVRHLHADHHELHFVSPRVELGSGKAFNPCPPGWQKHFDVFRDLHNHREGWARPDDPARIRPYAPEYTDLHRARLIRWGAIAKDSPDTDPRTAAKQAIHGYILAGIEEGRIGSRADVVQALTETGLTINRAGKDYITVKDQESGEKLRLKGGMYAEQWNFAHFVGRAHQGQDRAGTAGDGEFDPTTVQRLERELAAVIEKRAQYNRGRYPVPTRQPGAEHDFPLPDSERGLWLEVSASPGLDFMYPDGRGLGRLGAGNPGWEQGHKSAPGDSRTPKNQECTGNDNRLLAFEIAERIQRALCHSNGSPYPDRQLDIRESTRLETGVDHDRTGTPSERHVDHDGTGTGHHLGDPRQEAFRAATQAGRAGSGNTEPAAHPRPNPDRTAGISAALATLERYTHELGTLVGKVEHFIERQIERVREQTQQRSRGPGMGR